MFRFRELTLIGWDHWEEVRLPLDRDVVLLTGPNGSGKTTLLDAIRQLLNARRLSSRRRLQHYLREPGRPALIRAVVSNTANGSPPPFRRERIFDAEVTLACALVPGKGGAPEKRFAILPGRTDAEELKRHLLESRDWYAPERYAKALDQAGVTRSLLRLLAIEQGKTNSLFELGPRELLRRVLEMLGDQAVLDRYRDARVEYRHSREEVARQAAQLATLQVELRKVERAVRHLDEWEQARGKVADLEARLPAAELQVLIRRRKEAAAKIPELTTKVRRGETESVRLDAETRRLHETLANARAAHEEARTREREAQEAWGNARERKGKAETDRSDLDKKRREAEDLPIRDLPVLEAEEDRRNRALFASEQSLEKARTALRRIEKRIERLTAGERLLPEPVVETLQALRARGVACGLLADFVELADPAHGAAAEAALGDARYSLLVAGGDRARALAIACTHGFPGPVFTGERCPAPIRCGPLLLAPGAPEWLVGWAETVQTESDGSWCDQRGTWTAPASERILGEEGRRTELERARAALGPARTLCGELEDSRKETHTALRKARTACELERKRQALLREAGRLAQARVAHEAAQRELETARDQLEKAHAALDRARGAATDADRLFRDLSRRCEEHRTRLAGEKRSLMELEQGFAECEKEIAILAARVSPELRERVEQGALDGPDTVRADLERAQGALAEMGDPPDSSVRDEQRMLAHNVEEIEKHVAARRREAEAAERELDACRRRYLTVVEGALRDYRERVRGLCRVAGVEDHVTLPRLVDDDEILDEAGIEVAFGFDGKSPLALGDPAFSGGQQVIAALILLMAMAETDGEGFFMLDEPFAHLSLDRIDDVGAFLRGTKSQFLLTAPTTLDRQQLDPASLVIVTRKKRKGEAHAPVPIVAGR